MHRHMVAALVTVATVTPASGQTIGDTFKQFRSTLRQLGGAKQPKSDGTATPTTGTATTEATGDDMSMVPASVLVDDQSDTRLEGAPVAARRVETFDVRGFRLGMSPREAGRVAQRERFRRRWNSVFQTTGSFELEATRLANQKLNRPIERSSKVQLSKVQAFDAAGNEINLEFTLEPVGPRLSRLTYNAKLNGTTPAQAGAALVGRYGRPIEGQPGTGHMSWKNSAEPYDPTTPRLGAVIDEDSIMLFLDQSTNYGKEAYRRIEARASEIASSRGGGVRF